MRVFAVVGVIISLAASLAPGKTLINSNAPSDAVCIAGENTCDAPSDAAPASAGFVEYATPAEVDCRAAIGTVAVNSRADLQLDSGGCTEAAVDFRFHVSRLPDGDRPEGDAWAPQRTRRTPRHASTLATFQGLPGIPPLVIDSLPGHPATLAAADALVNLSARMLPSWRSAVLDGRGADRPEEPPRI